MNDFFVFNGKTDKTFTRGKIYLLKVGNGIRDGKPTIAWPVAVPYDSWEKFFQNWKRY